jgi:hypothetical protein
MAYKTKYKLLPRSILSVLREPVFDPKDGHGARSAHDVLILRKWKAAREGDDQALIELVKHIVREDLTMLKAARKQEQLRTTGPGFLKIRTLIPAAKVLGMITTKTVEVPVEWDGRIQVTSRQAITFSDWFAKYAFGRKAVNPAAVEYATEWLANGGIQRPWRGEVDD